MYRPDRLQWVTLIYITWKIKCLTSGCCSLISVQGSIPSFSRPLLTNVFSCTDHISPELSEQQASAVKKTFLIPLYVAEPTDVHRLTCDCTGKHRNNHIIKFHWRHYSYGLINNNRRPVCGQHSLNISKTRELIVDCRRHKAARPPAHHLLDCRNTAQLHVDLKHRHFLLRKTASALPNEINYKNEASVCNSHMSLVAYTH